MKNKEPKRILFIVLKVILNLNKLPYSSTELFNLSCYNSTKLIKFLQSRGYINAEKQLINSFDPTSLINEFECYVNKRTSLSTHINLQKLNISSTTQQLIIELNDRGYNVQPRKIV